MSPRLLVALGLAALIPSVALAAPAERGVTAYEEGDYAAAIEALSARLGLGVEDPVERTRLRAYLASAQLARQDRASSRETLSQLLADDPGAALDDTVFPPPLLQLLEEVRRERAAVAPPGSIERPTEPAPLAFAFVPLGVGQFANDEAGKGALFLGLQAAAFGTASVSLGMFEAAKAPGSAGLLAGGRFEDPARAERLQTTYLAAFWTGVAIAAIGVGDALLSRPEAP